MLPHRAVQSLTSSQSSTSGSGVAHPTTAFAKVNPITVTVDALRALVLGGPTATHVWQALAWVIGLLVITVPTAVLRYRHTTAG